jgi:predicted alpha/beta-fold hydrolase
MTLARPAAFAPPSWLVNAHLQSIVPSLRLRRPLVVRRARQMLRFAATQIVECGDGVRLLGHYSSQVAAGRPPARDLVILLHGWEGSADSMYVLSLGSYLFELGCDVYRLNFRDHGPSHHLNEEIFHSCRLDEVVGAVRAIQRAIHDRGLLARRQLRAARRGARAGCRHHA